jgi:uncharacterized protein (TIGR02302 family)
MIDSGARASPAAEATTRARIERAVLRARLNLTWEAVWPLGAPLLTLAAVFAAVSWLGLWRITSAPVRYVVLAAFAAAFVALVFRAGRFTAPGRAAAFARVEQATGLAHRPATSFADRLASAPDDPAAQALWIAHRRRLLAALDRLRAGVPAPRLAARDPYALRFLVALMFIVGAIVAGPERLERLGEAFRGGETAAATVARIDAWVTPPTYTGRPPIFLTGDTARPRETGYSVPTGSVVTVRIGGARDLAVISAGAAGETAVEAVDAAATRAGEAAPPVEHRVTLADGGSIVVRKGQRDVVSWRFAVEPDSAPEIALVGEPRATASGALALAYSLKDDYGVVGASADIAPAADALTAAGMRPLYEAPSLPLSLPQLRTRDGNGETTRDLTSHPWAGAAVALTLVARDEAAQEGRSPPFQTILPARRFGNPLARAVVEQRTRLALDANAADLVADALDAVTMSPEKDIKDIGHYLILRSAYHRLVNARDDDDLRGVVDYLWTIALGIEDGELSLAAQELRAAQEALRQALENNASDEEIARLTDELRRALQNFLQALAEEARRNPDVANLPPDADVQTLRSQDLDRLLDRIEDLARTGARDAARQLLSELQNMLENLQAGRPMMGNPQDGQMMQSLNELGDMIRRQEDLMNRTFRADRGLNPDSGQEMTAEELAEALRQLQQGQEGLEGRLQQLMEQLEGMGMQPNGKFGQAGEAMGRASGALGEGEPGAAVGEQGEALDALRQGAQGLSQQLANQGRGQGFGRGGLRGGDQFPNTDPLGRPQRAVGPDLGSTVRVPDEIDTQRAREILDAIRRRLGEIGRPEFEREYLERLLDRF